MIENRGPKDGCPTNHHQLKMQRSSYKLLTYLSLYFFLTASNECQNSCPKRIWLRHIFLPGEFNDCTDAGWEWGLSCSHKLFDEENFIVLGFEAPPICIPCFLLRNYEALKFVYEYNLNLTELLTVLAPNIRQEEKRPKWKFMHQQWLGQFCKWPTVAQQKNNNDNKILKIWGSLDTISCVLFWKLSRGSTFFIPFNVFCSCWAVVCRHMFLPT